MSRLKRPGPTTGVGIAIEGEQGDLIHVVTPEVYSAFRYLLARLQLNVVPGLPRRLALTSALDGEGVTFTSRSLAAVVAAELGRSVCVVDLNWTSPSDQSYAHTPGVGLVNCVDGVDLDSVICSTSLGNLSFVPAGRPSLTNGVGLANSPVLAGVIEELARRFDYLILDLPALLMTSDALTLARLCDAVALVVRSGVTTEAQVQAALDELRSIVLAGLILNRQQSRTPRWARELVSP